ncbi:YciI family protein [Pseudonocardia sp. GCM10023141]|uniref:YciI family protein n=1 Tax=Pseudonocardia sp. GCM10023141 TaxID=3252653 RepID=UPI0036145721
MTNFVLAYRGGSGMADTPEAQEQAMAAWGAWFGALGAQLVEGGNPFGASLTVHGDGSATDGGDAGLSGYSVVSATDLAAAANLAKGCPLLGTGGTVEVYEAVDM